MNSIDIQLPEALKAYVDEQVALRGHRDASEFMQSLLEAERRRQVLLEVEGMLLSAADGPFTDWTGDDLEDIRRMGRRLIDKRARS